MLRRIGSVVDLADMRGLLFGFGFSPVEEDMLVVC